MLHIKKIISSILMICLMVTSLSVNAFAASDINEIGNLIYGAAKEKVHIHDDSCICPGGELICGFAESEEPNRGDSCYEEGSLVCTTSEEGHRHSDACYCKGGEYICGFEENNEYTITETGYQGETPSLFSEKTATVYFGNDISQNDNPRYSAVSFRKVGETQWTYSSYFAPISYGECSEAFQLEPGNYEFVMNVAFKNAVSAITGTFTVTEQLTVENLISDAEGAEVQTQGQEFMIVAGKEVSKSSGSTSSKFFKVLQPAGFSEEQAKGAVSFYREDGTKMGVYNYSTSGTITILFPKKIMVGDKEEEQHIYYYEVSIPGYKTAKGSCTVDFDWQEDENFKAEKVVNSPTQGYQIYLAKESDTSVPLKFSVAAGDETAEITVKSNDDKELEIDENGLYQIPIPEENSEDYTFLVACEGYADYAGGFSIDSDGVITDTTTEEQKELSIAHEFSGGVFSIQLLQEIIVNEEDLEKDGYYYGDVTSQLLFGDSWYPGLTQTGKFIITNNTDQDLYIVGYDVEIKDQNGEYMIDGLMRCANEPIRALYGWDKDANADHDEESTLTDIVYVDEKIKSVYENSEEYINTVKDAYGESAYYTYPAYLYYYFKTTYPEKYGTISSLSELDDAAIEIVMDHFNGKSDQWYDGDAFRPYGSVFEQPGEIEKALDDGRIYQKDAAYGAAETYSEIDELMKEYLFKNGFYLSLDEDVDPAKNAPSLYDWSVQSEKAKTHFESVLNDGNLLEKPQAGLTVRSGQNSVLFDKVSLYLNGGAFYNITQQMTWDYGLNIILSAKNTPPASTEEFLITPASVTLYTGGKGYGGVVIDNNGTLTTDSGNGFPEPGFLITVPDSLKNIDITKDLTLQYEDGNEKYVWEFKKYGEGNHNVYAIRTKGTTENRPIRMELTREDDGKDIIVDTDNFVVEDYLNQELSMTIYGDSIDQSKVFFVYNGVKYPFQVDEAKLMIRATTGEEDYASLTGTLEADRPYIEAESGTIYTINGKEVQVRDTSGIALLFDDIIEKNTEGKIIKNF